MQIAATTSLSIFCHYSYLPKRDNRLQNAKLILFVNFRLTLDSLNEHLFLLKTRIHKETCA